MHRPTWILAACLVALPAAAETVDEALADYRQAGAGAFSAERGEQMWNRNVSVEGQDRSCVTCHGSDLRQAGEHARTGKRIDPMAPSVNSERFTKRRDIEKWFLRNCKWTWGRECTPQEKGDFLSYLRTR